MSIATYNMQYRVCDTIIETAARVRGITIATQCESVFVLCDNVIRLLSSSVLLIRVYAGIDIEYAIISKSFIGDMQTRRLQMI